MDEQLVDTDSEEQSSENVNQKMNLDLIDKNYKYLQISLMKLQKLKR